MIANDVAGADGVSLDHGRRAGDGDRPRVLRSTTTTAPSPTRRTRAREGADSFTYTITDGDGDTSTATVTLTIAADSTPQVGTPTQPRRLTRTGLRLRPTTPSTARVDETDSTESLTQSGTVVVNFGNDVPAESAGLDRSAGHGLRWMVSCRGSTAAP